MMLFAGNKMQNLFVAFLAVQIPPLLRQRRNVAVGLPYKSSFGPQSNLSLRPLA